MYGDHADPVNILKRDWRSYNNLNLLDRLKAIEWDYEIDQVQQCWNSFESKLVAVVDNIALLVIHRNNIVTKSINPPIIKNKINIRKRLLKQTKKRPTNKLRDRIKKSRH